MNRIERLIIAPAVGAYYNEDLTALQENPLPLADRYTAAPVTRGFRAVRQTAQAVSVGLLLDSGQVAWGDCVAVAYGGKAGREPIFSAASGMETIEQIVSPTLQGRELTGFRELARLVDSLTEKVSETRSIPRPEVDTDQPTVGPSMSRRELLAMPARLFRSVRQELESERAPDTETVVVDRVLHPAIRYGVSQALLQAVALSRNCSMAEVVAEEWGLSRPDQLVPIHAQSGAERYHNADKMIVRRVDSLPHALVDDIPDQLGSSGGQLVRYVRWLAARIKELAGDEYRPTIHLDVHGALGKIFDNKAGQILGQLGALEYAAKPYPLRIECPVIMDSRAEQIEMLKKLRNYVRLSHKKVQLVADEWANTLDDIQAFIDAGAADMIQIKMPDLGSVHNTVNAVLACQAGDIGAFLGGSCAETDLSARVSVHVALATRPDIVMAKPGMGVDEGISLVRNEMARTLAWIGTR